MYAELTTPNPTTFTIAADSTTELVFIFDVPEFEDVVFALGNLEFSIDVVQSTRPTGGVATSGTFATLPEFVADTVPAAVRDALIDPENTAYGFSAVVERTGEFALFGPDVACADALVTEAEFTGAGNWQNFAAEFADEARICYAQLEGDTDFFVSRRRPDGAPSTAALAELPGANYLYRLRYRGAVGLEIFTGTTIDFSRVPPNEVIVLTNPVVSGFIIDQDTDEVIYSASHPAVTDVQITP